jgi:hypothetical protein
MLPAIFGYTADHAGDKIGKRSGREAHYSPSAADVC